MKGKNWNNLIKVLKMVKTIEEESVMASSYLVKDLGLDSIGIVDFWFEMRNEFLVEANLNDFYRHIRSHDRGEFYNDFNLQELTDYLKINLDE